MLMALVALAGAAVVLLLLATYRADRLAALSGVLVMSLFVLIPTFYLGDATNLRTLALVGSVGVATVLAVRRKMNPLRRRGAWLLVAYFAVVGLATFLNPAGADIALFVNAAVPGLAMLFIVLVASADERRIIGRWIIGLAVAESVYALAEVLGFASRLWGNSAIYLHQIVPGLTRAEGTLGHPLMLALLLLVAIAFTLGTYGPSRGVKRFALIAVLFAGLFSSGSRSATIIGVLFLLFAFKGHVIVRVVLGAFAAIVLIVGLTAAEFFQGDIVTNFLTGDSVNHRAGALESVPGLVTLQPWLNVTFGNGFYSARALYDAGLLQQGAFFAVDNQFVLTLVEGGVIALALLAAVIVRAFWVGRGAWLPLIAVVFFFATFDVLAWSTGAALFGLVVGLAMQQNPTTSLPEATLGGAGQERAGEPYAVSRR